MASTRQWFSHAFGIDKPQFLLAFVDFDLNSDVPLYIDPYAITKDPSELAARCHNAILSYFDTLLAAIQANDRQALRHLLSGKLSEPSQIHLGVSKRARGGRGIGTEQERAIVEALRGSAAAKAGAIQSIQEMELHIRNVGSDKVSDLVANIILNYLAAFTERICAEEGIATRPCPVDGFWNAETREWDAAFFNLPRLGTDSFILVPKRFVRRERDLMNHREFYSKYVLETLQRELLTANDSLVRTLKKGARKVDKKDIEEDPRFALSKEFISEFIIEHPDVIQAYRDQMINGYRPVDPAIWSGRSDEDDPVVRQNLDLIPTLPPGKADAQRYHDAVFIVVRFVFDYALENFECEYKMDGERGRIDILCDNLAGGGFFLEARFDYGATTVPMECKNYSDDLGNEEFNQIVDRMGPATSRLGMICCRTISDPAAIARHQTDRWLRSDKLILVIDDARLAELARLRLARDFQGIDSLLRRMVRAVRYGNDGS